MRAIICRNIHREIDEAGQGDPLSPVANDHLKNCVECEAFYNEQFKLRQIVSSLGTVAAPGDFDFRLRARLAGEKRGAARTTMNFSFGLRFAAVGAVLLLVGSAFLFANLRPEANDSLVPQESANLKKPDAVQPQNTMSVPGENSPAPPVSLNAVGQRANESVAADTGPNSRGRRVTRKSTGLRSTEVALNGNPRVATKDSGSSPAPVLTADNMVAVKGYSVFPIEASPQSLKVSLDNGRGSSKTISVPGVSFGSQQVLSQGASPLLASARGAW